MVFSTDETPNKAITYAGVPDSGDSSKQLEVSEWLTAALGPPKGRCGKGKGGLAQGQGMDASHVKEAMDVVTTFASMKLRFAECVEAHLYFLFPLRLRCKEMGGYCRVMLNIYAWN